MMLVCRVPELLAAKFGGSEKINLSQIMRETGMAYTSVNAWAKGKVERFDTKALETWCKYLHVQPGALFDYVPDQARKEDVSAVSSLRPRSTCSP